jgi:predicted phage terminase large subunit-like protein
MKEVELTSQQAAELLLRRRVVRGSLIEFARELGYKAARHHVAMCELAQQQLRGEIGNVLIFSPPGSAKSFYMSVLLPAFILASQKDATIIACSHTTSLAESFGRRVRSILTDHAGLLGVELRADSAAAGRFETSAGGIYHALGVGSAVVGLRGSHVIIDDPLRGTEDAASAIVRRGQWDWFTQDVRTRMKPGGKITLVMTRWHEEDLAGRILAEMEAAGEQWSVLRLPAEAEADDPIGRPVGEWLWSDNNGEYDYPGFLQREKATQSPLVWSGMFQQRPSPETGTYFLRDWLKPCAKRPPLDTLRIYGGSDYAVSEGRGDYTVHLVVGCDPDDKLYLLDLWRGQKTPDVWVNALLDLAERYRPQHWAEETGQIRAGVGPFLEKRAFERRVPLFRQTFPTKHDKTVRAQSIRGRMSMSGLYVDMKAPWFPAFQEEILRFPAGKHDDQVDALALVGQLLATMVPGVRRKPPPKKNFLDDYQEINDDMMQQRPGESWDDFLVRHEQAKDAGTDLLC